MREAEMVLRGVARTREREVELVAMTALVTADLMRRRRLPRSHTELIRKRDVAPQDWRTMKTIASMWTAALGG